MFSEPSGRHHVPHFHADYGEHVAVFSISPVALIIGFIPQRQQRLVEAWADLHEGEIFADWLLLEQGRKPSPITPLQQSSAMNHPIYRITFAEYIPPDSLRLSFDDGLNRTIDFEPILEGELYGPLRDPAAFAQVTLDPEIHTVVWPCGADFDPATLHDWPEHDAAFHAAAERWRHSLGAGKSAH